MKRTKNFISILTLSALFVGSYSTANHSNVYAATLSATTSPGGFSFNNHYIRPTQEYVPINFNGHIYVSARFVAENMGVTTTWDPNTKTVSFVTQTGQAGVQDSNEAIPASQIQVETENVNFIFNGNPVALDSQYQALNYNGHIYVPVRFVAEHLGAVVGWDEESKTVDIVWINGPDNSLLTWFAHAYPNENIGSANMVQFENGQSYLVVQNKPNWLKGKSGNIYFVSPDRTVMQFSSNAEYPMPVTTFSLSSGTIAEVGGGAGAHGEYEYFFNLQNNQPTVIDNFFADNGILSWIQDGKLDILVSNRTYKWDLVTPDGQKDDSSNNTVYEYNPDTLSFSTIDTYTTGVFQMTDMNSNPRADAAESIAYLRNLLQPSSNVPIYVPHMLASSAISDANNLQPTLSFVNSKDDISLQTIDESDTKADYLYQNGGHSLLISLQKDSSWHVTDFAVDPSNQTLQQLTSGITN